MENGLPAMEAGITDHVWEISELPDVVRTRLPISSSMCDIGG
jgi:hypothetical protein